MIEFDKKGNITPYKIIELTLSDFEHIFVIDLENKKHRRNLFQNYFNVIIQIIINKIKFLKKKW